jgi:hypothetical protein
LATVAFATLIEEGAQALRSRRVSKLWSSARDIQKGGKNMMKLIAKKSVVHLGIEAILVKATAVAV